MTQVLTEMQISVEQGGRFRLRSGRRRTDFPVFRAANIKKLPSAAQSKKEGLQNEKETGTCNGSDSLWWNYEQ